MEGIQTETKRLALQYVQLQFKSTSQKLSPDELAEMESIRSTTGLGHEELVKIATNDVVAE
ncbi:MAG: hypothetical protein RLY57_349 [Candidatus Parcubacteria bacterium]|jgi:hypothetical protein